jgi:hypothetical protein
LGIYGSRSTHPLPKEPAMRFTIHPTSLLARRDAVEDAMAHLDIDDEATYRRVMAVRENDRPVSHSSARARDPAYPRTRPHQGG